MKKSRQAVNPILPGNKQDRVNAGPILRRVWKEIRVRFDHVTEEVLKLFDGIRTLRVNLDLTTIYVMTPNEMELFSNAVEEIVQRWIAEGKTEVMGFWYSPYQAEAQTQGTAASVANLTKISAEYATSRTLAQVVNSLEWRNRVAMSQLKSMDHWTATAADTRARLTGLIGRAVAEGRSPIAARKMIREEMEVSKFVANRWAQTDITDTLRGARITEAEDAVAALGIEIGLLWTSALKPTTRKTHASRHGKVYTPDEVKDFYSITKNRYNCYCATTECLLNNGKPDLSKTLKSAMIAELKNWTDASK